MVLQAVLSPHRVAVGSGFAASRWDVQQKSTRIGAAGDPGAWLRSIATCLAAVGLSEENQSVFWLTSAVWKLGQTLPLLGFLWYKPRGGSWVLGGAWTSPNHNSHPEEPDGELGAGRRVSEGNSSRVSGLR